MRVAENRGDTDLTPVLLRIDCASAKQIVSVRTSSGISHTLQKFEGANRMRTMTVRGKNPEASNSSLLKIVSFAVNVLPILLALILLATPYAQAQFDTASVLGTIKDPSGAGIASASVTLLSPSKGVSVVRQTDANGNYEFTNVQPGEYSISVTAANF